MPAQPTPPLLGICSANKGRVSDWHGAKPPGQDLRICYPISENFPDSSHRTALPGYCHYNQRFQGTVTIITDGQPTKVMQCLLSAEPKE